MTQLPNHKISKIMRFVIHPVAITLMKHLLLVMYLTIEYLTIKYATIEYFTIEYLNIKLV